MRKPFALLFLVFLAAGFIGVRAQTPSPSLKNTVWKFYVEPLNDTLTMHIGVDTNYSMSSAGQMIVRSLWKESRDTLRINDIDGAYPCHDGEGVYRWAIDGDTMTWTLLSDPCPDRASSLAGLKFVRSK